MIKLKFTAGPRAGQTMQLKTALATAGRSPSCDIIIDDPMVSGVHATFEQVPAGYIVTDQQSSNGTLINGQRIMRALMHVGDELVIGSTGMTVETSDGFAATMFGGALHPMKREAVEVRGTVMPPVAAAGPPILEIVGAMGQGVRTMPIPPGGVVIGRHPENGCVVDDPQISGKHLKIVIGPEGPVVTDLGSSNGTFVNDERIGREAPQLLGPEDSLRIGALNLRVRAARAAPVGASVPVAPPAAAPPPVAPAAAATPAASQWFIDVVDGAEPQRVEIPAHGALTIGRLPTSSIVLADPQSSGQHCQVVLGPTGPLLSDVGSRNGTFLMAASGERRVQPKVVLPLKPGDIFRVGAVTMRAARVVPANAEVVSTARAPGPSASVGVAEPASVMSELPIEQHVPKALRGAKIKFIAGPRAGTAVAVVPIERVVVHIGRASDNDISLEDGSVSARHCTITAEERGFVLRDNGSTNGCFVNGERLPAKGHRLLMGGDLIRVGLDSVFEFAMEGAAGKTFAHSQSVHAEGAMSGGISPRFVIRGAVVKKWKATIGRDVACDLFIDDPEIARSAIEIEFQEMRFHARALAAGALEINGKLVGEAVIKTGAVITVGRWSLRMEVTGARLTVHERVDHNSLNSSWAREAESAAQVPLAIEGMVPSTTAGGKPVFQTMFATDAAQMEKFIPKRDKKKAAPKWKATSDLLADRGRGGAAVIGLVAAAMILIILYAGKREAAFLDGDLARGHDSARFVELAHDQKAPKDGCQSCHVPGQKVAAVTCQGCHPAFQPKKGLGAQAGHDHLSAGLTCAGCHEEHKGASRGEALVARASCARSGCHDSGNPPHQKVKQEAPTPFLLAVKMPAPAKVTMPRGDAKQAQEQLHAIHGNVNRKCMACHTASDGQSAGMATAACFRCHDAGGVKGALAGTTGPGGSGSDSKQCLGCHAMHDQTLARVTDAQLGARWTGGVSPARTGGVAVAAVLALFLLAGGFASVYFGRRVDHVAKLALEEPGENRPAAKGESAAPGEAVARPNDHAGVKLKVNVNLEKCVGCACCVNACPTAVLEIVSHKSTVTQEAACTSCRECEKVCPSGALTMAAEGAPPRLIDMPDLDSHYQTNVPGLYLIGEAAGKSLVKNACNLGRVVVDHMVATGLKPGMAARHGADVEVLSVGSGPGGLSAALTAKRHGLSYAIIEKDRVYASTIQYCPKGKEFLAEPFDVKNISLLPITDTTKEKLIEAWDEVLRRENVEIRLGEEVLDIKQENGLFVVTTARGVTKALRVVMSPGTRGNPRKLGVAGQELDKVSYMLVDPAEHQGHHVMVVGGGDSAVECAMALAAQPGNVVTLSYRKDAFARIKPRNQERIDQHIKEGKIQAIFNSAPVEVRPEHMVLKVKDTTGDRTVEVPNQFVYCLLGADLPMVWLQQLGVKYVKKPEGWNPGPTDQIQAKPQAVAA